MNWKTTLAGWVSGGAINLIPYLQTGHLDGKTLAIGFAIGVLGSLAKDSDVTGGSRPSTPILK